MDFTIRQMIDDDWTVVVDIYKQGMKTKNATFETVVPTFEDWDKGHLKVCRLIAEADNIIFGWLALTPVSNRYVYRGVAEVSVYLDERYRGKKIGEALLNRAIEESDKNGIWTLQSTIFDTNEISIALHKKCGFRIVGVREKQGCDGDGIWRNVVLMEKRSKTIGV